MPFTVKLQDIIIAEPAFANLGKASFPAGVSYKLGKRLRAVAIEHKDFNEKRGELFKRYGEPVPVEPGATADPNRLRIKQDLESQKAFAVELNDLLNVEVELNTEKMKLADLEKADPALTPNDYMLLEPFIEE